MLTCFEIYFCRLNENIFDLEAKSKNDEMKLLKDALLIDELQEAQRRFIDAIEHSQKEIAQVGYDLADV